MPQSYSQEQIYSAMRKADAAGDAEAVKALAEALRAGATADELNAMAAERGLQLNQQDLQANIASRESGGPVNTVQPPDRGVAANTAIAYGKGAAKAVAGPYDLLNEVAGGAQKAATGVLTYLPAMGLDALGADELAQVFRTAGDRRFSEIDRTTNALSVRGALDRTVETPEGYEQAEFNTELATGLLLPLGPKGSLAPVRAPQNALAPNPRVLPDAAQIVQEGVRRNVPVMTTDVKPPRSGMGRYIKQTLPEKIPFAGTSGNRLAQQEARQQAVIDLVEEYGGDAGRELFNVGESLAEQVSRNLTTQRSERLTRLTNAKRSVIEGIEEPFTSAPNTVRAINEQVRALKDIDATEFAPVIERLQRFGDALTSGKSLSVVEEQRKLLGEMFADGNLASIKDRGSKAINAIYPALRSDMASFIEANAGQGAVNRWSKANDELAAMAGELKSSAFKNVLKQADMTPEAIGRILFSSPDNISDMKRLVSNLDRDGRRKVQAALLQRAFDTAGGADGVSVERFLNNLKRLSGKIGVAFEGPDRQALEGTRRLLEATRRGAEAGANVRTGEQNLPAIMGIGATQALGFTGGIASLGVGGLLARVYESPAIRNRLIGLGKSKPGSRQEQVALQAIMREATPIVNNWKESIARATNDNASGALAAEEQNEGNN